MKPEHLIFYDGECPLCNRSVRMLLKRDKHKRFLFAPLQGETAIQHLVPFSKKLKGVDSLVLLENYHSSHPSCLIYGKAALRICWHLGGAWRLIGWLSFLPTFLADTLYRLIARHRHLL